VTDRKIFGVGVRLFGLWLLVWQGVFRMVVSVPDRHLGGYVIGGLVGVVIGLVLMKGEWIVRFVYGPELTKENSN
jgi:uncharacterized membrane protein HdeD (DUF308 family)